MGQQIRLSQFIFNYGPGAIIETINGPRIIQSFDTGLFNSSNRINGKELNPEDFEINNQCLTYGLLDGVRIFRIPSNAELNIDENVSLYFTKSFPDWALCVKEDILYNLSKGCPNASRCGNCSGRNRRDAIRFVRACPNGHLDDVDWNYAVHENFPCRSEWFRWIRQGAGLKDIYIQCPRCGRKVSMGYIYQRDMPCSGRLPEKREVFESCDKSARVIQRQASNLRIPEIISIFTVPPRHTALHRLLENRIISSNIDTNRPESKEELKRILDRLVERKDISPVSRDEILKYDWEFIKKAIDDVSTKVPSNYREMLVEEFHRLIDASLYGVAATKAGEPEYLFEIIKSKVMKFKSPGGRSYRVAPVSRLNTVIVQRGYRRFIGTGSDINEARLVEIFYTDKNNNKWLPGIEVLGEGIFIMLDENEGWHFEMSGDSCSRWRSAYHNNSSDYPGNLFRYPEAKDELHPVFVWWHTLAHMINRTISVDSGYSAASIRERVYLELADDGRARGGILLYTVQPGADGTLGGLISLVPHFDDILSSALEKIDSCSNDPICEESSFFAGRCIGAACYACALISETSCEHRNFWLDRKILMENMP